VPVIEIETTLSLMLIVGILLVTVIASLTSPKGRALVALQNAEKYSYRYTKLDESASEDERRRAEELMDKWTRAAEQVSPRHREELLEHKDGYSQIIRTAHETRLASAHAEGRDVPTISQTIVDN